MVLAAIGQSPSRLLAPRALSPALPRVPGPCTPLPTGGAQKAEAREQQDPAVIHRGRGSGASSQTSEAPRLRTGREDTPNLDTSAVQRGEWKTPEVPSPPPSPHLSPPEPRVIHTKEDSPQSRGSPGTVAKLPLP